jgi:hypothetical protein
MQKRNGSPVDGAVIPLGYASYEDYLRSPLWASIRSRVFELKGWTCLRCKSAPAKQVHHTRYEPVDMRGERLLYLEPICVQCHRGEHAAARARMSHQVVKRVKTKAAKPVDASGVKLVRLSERQRKHLCRDIKAGRISENVTKTVKHIEFLVRNGATEFSVHGLPQKLVKRIVQVIKSQEGWRAAMAPRGEHQQAAPNPNRNPLECEQCRNLLSKAARKKKMKLCAKCLMKSEPAAPRRGLPKELRKPFSKAAVFASDRPLKGYIRRTHESDPLSQEYRDIVR